MVQLSKTGSEFKNILRDVPESKQSVDEEGMNIEKEKSAYCILVYMNYSCYHKFMKTPKDYA